jgi:hypothetical protein
MPHESRLRIHEFRITTLIPSFTSKQTNRQQSSQPAVAAGEGPEEVGGRRGVGGGKGRGAQGASTQAPRPPSRRNRRVLLPTPPSMLGTEGTQPPRKKNALRNQASESFRLASPSQRRNLNRSDLQGTEISAAASATQAPDGSE